MLTTTANVFQQTVVEITLPVTPGQHRREGEEMSQLQLFLFCLAFFYVAPPLLLAYIGRGLGELDILISFGILPLLGSYYIQTGHVTLNAVLASLPVGLYTTAVLYFHHFVLRT